MNWEFIDNPKTSAQKWLSDCGQYKITKDQGQYVLWGRKGYPPWVNVFCMLLTMGDLEHCKNYQDSETDRKKQSR